MPVHDHTRGATCLVAAAFLFAAMAAVIKTVTATRLPNEVIVLFRNIFGLAALLPWVLHRGIPSLATGFPLIHVLRSVAGLGAMYCFFFAIAYMPLADVMVLNYTAPLFVPLLAMLWLDEKVTPRLWFAIALGFAGIVLILKPGLGIFTPVALIGLASGLLAAVSIVTIRRMAHHEPTVRIVFYYSAIATLVSVIPAFWAWQTPTPSQLVLLILTGVLATGGQLLLTHGYTLAPAARIGPFTYTAVIFAALFGWTLWSEVPDSMSIGGAALVCIAGVLAIRHMGIATAPVSEDDSTTQDQHCGTATMQAPSTPHGR